MHFKRLLTLSVTSLILCSASYADSNLTPTQAMNQIRIDHPNLMTVDRAGQIHKILDKELSTGRTPLASAENFIKKFSTALDVNENEFVERGPFADQHSHQDFMYNRETGEHKFTGVY